MHQHCADCGRGNESNMAKVERMSIELTQQNTQKAFALCAFSIKRGTQQTSLLYYIYISFLDFFDILDSRKFLHVHKCG